MRGKSLVSDKSWDCHLTWEAKIRVVCLTNNWVASNIRDKRLGLHWTLIWHVKQQPRVASDTGGKWLGRAVVASSDIRAEANVRCLVSGNAPNLVPQKNLDARPGAMSSYNGRGKVMNRSVDDNAALGISSGALQLAHLLFKMTTSTSHWNLSWKTNLNWSRNYGWDGPLCTWIACGQHCADH